MYSINVYAAIIAQGKNISTFLPRTKIIKRLQLNQNNTEEHYCLLLAFP